MTGGAVAWERTSVTAAQSRFVVNISLIYVCFAEWVASISAPALKYFLVSADCNTFVVDLPSKRMTLCQQAQSRTEGTT
jgi:hypothetical protein